MIGYDLLITYQQWFDGEKIQWRRLGKEVWVEVGLREFDFDSLHSVMEWMFVT